MREIVTMLRLCFTRHRYRPGLTVDDLVWYYGHVEVEGSEHDVIELISTLDGILPRQMIRNNGGYIAVWDEAGREKLIQRIRKGRN